MMHAATCLITGATAGIGRHLALDLAARGHSVIATGRDTDALAALEAAARLQHRHVLTRRKVSWWLKRIAPSAAQALTSIVVRRAGIQCTPS